MKIFGVSQKREIKKTKILFYKKVWSSKHPEEIWKTIYLILIPSQTRVKNANKLNANFNTTARWLTKAKCQSKRKLRNISLNIFKISHSHSFKIHKISIDETEKELKTAFSDCSTGDDNIHMQLIKPIASYIAIPLTIILNSIV